MNQNNSPTQETFSFPVGYHTFHKNKDINFQLNRFYSFGYWAKADAEEASKSIREIGDWRLVLTGSAEKHKAEGCPLRSVTGRVFTSKEHAQNHCQVGNVKLALDVILDCINAKS